MPVLQWLIPGNGAEKGVIQWISNLPGAIIAIKNIISPNGKLIITLTNPNASYCGYWKTINDNYIWVRTEIIPSKKLVMINRMVGPLWYFGRSTEFLINEIIKQGFSLSKVEEIFLDSYLEKKNVNKFLKKWPAFQRALLLPSFIYLEFTNV